MDRKVALENADLVGTKMGDARQRNAITRQRVAMDARGTAGRAQARAGASGLDITTGSPLDAVYESFANMQRDFVQADRNTDAELLDLDRERRNYLAQAEGASGAVRSERSARTINTFASLASGAADIYKARIVDR